MSNYKSKAVWPKGTMDHTDNITTDYHLTYKQAREVCDMLEENGFSGEGKIFPLTTVVVISETV